MYCFCDYCCMILQLNFIFALQLVQARIYGVGGHDPTLNLNFKLVPPNLPKELPILRLKMPSTPPFYTQILKFVGEEPQTSLWPPFPQIFTVPAPKRCWIRPCTFCYSDSDIRLCRATAIAYICVKPGSIERS